MKLPSSTDAAADEVRLSDGRLARVRDAALLAGEPSRLLVQQYGVAPRDVAPHKRAHLLQERGRPMRPPEGAPRPAALRRR